MAEFGEFFMTGSSIDTNDVRVEYLDYSYIDECSDPKMLRAIVKVLKSGKEGLYPDLEKYAENKLLECLPKKERERIQAQSRTVTAQETYDAKEGLDDWLTNMTSMDSKLKIASKDDQNDEAIESINFANADKHRVKGNDFFRSGDTQKAYDSYTKAIELSPSDPKLYTNRAIAAHKLEKYLTAEKDCTEALSLPSLVKDTEIKAYTRRGLSRVKQGKYGLAIEDLLCAHERKSTKEVKALLDNARTMYESVEGQPYIDERGILRAEVEEYMLTRKVIIACGKAKNASTLIARLSDTTVSSSGACECSMIESEKGGTRLIIEEEEEETNENSGGNVSNSSGASSVSGGVEAGFKRISIVESDSESDSDDGN